MLQNIKYGNSLKFLEKELINFDYSKVAILVDNNTYEHCFPLISNIQNHTEIIPIGIKAGEKNKNLETAHYIWKSMKENMLDRSSLLINLGGGVVCDIGGFCASTYMRGIEYIQIPTSLLAQVDASVGGKTGIDLDHMKNMIGVINQPKKVIIDNTYLKTLILRERISGYAEMIKHALIDCMGHYRELMKSNIREEIPSTEMIKKSVYVKELIVDKDPLEKNIRKSLNFGHTIGHAVETHFLSISADIRHGEAIACGIVCALYLSCKLKNLPERTAFRIVDDILQVFPRLNLQVKDFDSIWELCTQDKKNIRGIPNFVLLSALGQVHIDIPVEKEYVLESLRFYQEKVRQIEEEE